MKKILTFLAALVTGSVAFGQAAVTRGGAGGLTVQQTGLQIPAPKFTTSASLSTGYLSTTKTAGTTGTTANLLVKLDSSGNVVTAATSDVGILGIAATTATNGNPVEIATRGIINGVADNTTVIGNVLIVGTLTGGRVRDSGTTDSTSIPLATQVVGKALSVATVGNAVSIQLYGPGHYGAQAGTGSGSVTSVSVATANGVSGSVANPTTTPAITITLGAITPSSVVTTGSITSGSGGSTAGVFELGQGTAPSDGTTSVKIYAATGVTSYKRLLPATVGSTGFVLETVSGTTQTESLVGFTGTVDVVRSTTPTLITPVLGVATATSINKVALTAPATSSTLTIADGKTLTASQTVTLNYQSSTGLPVEFYLACSDLTTTLTTGTTKAYFRAPYAFTVTEVRASVNTPQTSGSLLTVDINDSGTTILSTKLTIDNNETTSTTAATPPVISDTAIADDAIIAVDIDTVGTGAVTGLIVLIKGYR